jgi:hypothetical protein
MLGRILTVLLGIFLATPISAEPVSMGIILQCESESGKMFDLTQSKYGEIPLASGEGIFMSLTGQWKNAHMFMTVNPETKSYSIIIVDPETGTECMLLPGGNFRPITMPQGDPS